MDYNLRVISRSMWGPSRTSSPSTTAGLCWRTYAWVSLENDYHHERSWGPSGHQLVHSQSGRSGQTEGVCSHYRWIRKFGWADNV